jgi:hypothetical protein
MKKIPDVDPNPPCSVPESKGHCLHALRSFVDFHIADRQIVDLQNYDIKITN